MTEMSTTRLPELPEAQWWYTDDSQAAMNMGFGLPEEKPLFTADQMHAYGLAVWKAAMQRAEAELREAAEAHREAAAEETDQQCSEWHRATDAAYSCAAGILSSLPLPEQGGPQ